MKPIDHLLTEIAREHLDIPTLKSRTSDAHDFHEVSVWGVTDALLAAYQAGASGGTAQSGQGQETLDSRHAPEPWTESGMAIVQDAQGNIVADCDSPDLPPARHRVNACRIVTAINACAGIPTGELERGILRDLLVALKGMLGKSDYDATGHCRGCGREREDESYKHCAIDDDVEDCPFGFARAVIAKATAA